MRAPLLVAQFSTPRVEVRSVPGRRKDKSRFARRAMRSRLEPYGRVRDSDDELTSLMAGPTRPENSEVGQEAAVIGVVIAGVLVSFTIPGPYDWGSTLIGLLLLSVLFAYGRAPGRKSSGGARLEERSLWRSASFSSPGGRWIRSSSGSEAPSRTCSADGQLRTSMWSAALLTRSVRGGTGRPEKTLIVRLAPTERYSWRGGPLSSSRSWSSGDTGGSAANINLKRNSRLGTLDPPRAGAHQQGVAPRLRTGMEVATRRSRIKADATARLPSE